MTDSASEDAFAGQRELTQGGAREHAARVSAEASVFARDRVLSLVSHDLRGPLNAIHSWAHVLERKLASEEAGVARAISGIRTGVEQQVRMIEDAIDRTRNATRHLSLTLTTAPVEPVVLVEIDALQQAIATPLGVDLKVDFALRDVEGTLDPMRFGQAVWTIAAFAVYRHQEGTPIEIAGVRDGDRLEVSVVFAPTLAQAEGRSLPDFMSLPQNLDNGLLPLALPTRVAAAHGGELCDETLVDGRRRLALRQPLHARMN